MTHFNFDTMDKHSIGLCAVTVFFKMLTWLIEVPSLGNVASMVAILTGISTLVYNAIRIRKEIRDKKENK